MAVLRVPGHGQGAERRRDVAGAHSDAPGLLHQARPGRPTWLTGGLQELIDDFVMKLRAVRFLRTPEYDELFSGDPSWVTETLGGVGEDGRPLVTRTSLRYLQTLYTSGRRPT